MMVRASTLSVGETIRDPRKVDRILVVTSVGSKIFVRGYEQADTSKHRFLSPDTFVEKVTNASTETTVEPKEGEGG